MNTPIEEMTPQAIKYPADFIPKGGVEFVGIDYAKDGSYCTVKGFFKEGIWHIQSVEYREAMKDE